MASTSAMGHPKQWGVTTPRSLAEPTEADRVSTGRLVQVLTQSYPYKIEERHRKKGVLEKLATILKNWVKELATERLHEVNAKLVTFGCYRLQVDEPENAIDTLCIGPNFVNREHHFLNILPGKLEKLREVEGMERVPDAPISFLSFKFHEVPIKLVYASVPCFVISEELDICRDSVLENIDDAITLRTLSACRVAPSILELVPNLESFQKTLWYVKHWAKARGIWSNVSGFLGESAWSILVARVCQAYPMALPSTLVIQFFDIFANWSWPNPVMLCQIEHKNLCKQHVWDCRKYAADKDHCMPIIAPAYPCTNLTSDATFSTLRVMKEHFKFGDEKCKEINNNNANWQDLFVPFKFFEKYPRYLHIDIIADSEENLWNLKRWIESKLMSLISQVEKSKVLICHPCPVEFASSDSCAFFIGMSSKNLLTGLQYVKIVDPLTAELENGFNGWKVKKPDMKVRIYKVGNQNIKSRTWGKFELPVVEMSAVP